MQSYCDVHVCTHHACVLVCECVCVRDNVHVCVSACVCDTQFLQSCSHTHADYPPAHRFPHAEVVY